MGNDQSSSSSSEVSEKRKLSDDIKDLNGEESKDKKAVVNDASKWQVIDTPQDAGFLPTLAVTFWLGWMGALVKISLVVLIWGSTTAKMIWIGLCTLSLLLPANFPEPYGRTHLGHWLMKHAEKYFGLKTTIEDPVSIEKLAQEKAIIFAKEPHDVLPYSVFCFSDSLARILPEHSNMKALTTGAVFNIPFIKQVYSWVGCAPVDKKTFKRRLEKKESFCFIPGGAQEVLRLSDIKEQQQKQLDNIDGAKKASEDGQEDTSPIPLYLKSRKGFIKLALSTGSPICPVFAFGLDKSYDYMIPPGLSTISRKMGFVPVLFTGRFGIPFGIPKVTKIHVVIGTPIEIPKMDLENAGNEKIQNSIDKYHALYLQELEALYKRHKDDAGYGKRNLIIF